MKNYLDKFKLKNKKSVVLGGLGLLGSSITEALLSAGSEVLILDIDKKKGKDIKNIFNSSRVNFLFFDSSKLDAIDKKINKIINNYLPDIFINCSYPVTKDWYKSTYEENTLKIMRRNTDIHLNSYAWTSTCVAKIMKKKKIEGAIILLGSIYGSLGQKMSIYKNTKMRENMNYPLIKGGIINHVKQLASYYGKYNIRVNAVSPGGIRGHIKGSKLKQNSIFIKNYSENTPLCRLGDADEVASAVLFLSSNASSYITGINFLVDGGWSSI